MGILSGIRVLDITHAVAGPALTQILADLGADVIKVERPEGDMFRNLPVLGPTFFLPLNKGKRGIVVDFKKDEGANIVRRLAERSDILVENLRPGALEEVGLGYEKLRELNPGLIYVKITGFGEGPYEEIPAWDPVLEAASGIMSVTGFPPDRYVRTGISLVDVTAALYGAIAVLLALRDRERTGKGHFIEVSLFDSAVSYMTGWIVFYDLYGRDPLPLGTKHLFAAPYGLFKVKDGYVYIAVSNDEYWREFCKVFGFEDLLRDERYSTNELRVRNREELESEIERRLSEVPLVDVVNKLRGARVPVAPLNKVSTLLQDPHLRARDLLRELVYGETRFRTTASPFRIDGYREFNDAPPPRLGEHTEIVLREVLGLSDADIKRLREEGVIR